MSMVRSTVATRDRGSPRAPLRTRALAFARLAVALLAPGVAGAQQPLGMSERVEARLLERLAAVQTSPGAEIAPFTTDGCSGGLSRGWKYLSRRFPQLADSFGDRPPWEACCVEHDRLYWQGSTNDGYAARKSADEALRLCVHDRGVELRDELAERWQSTPEEVQAAFDLTGQIMYGAVRIGGRPCTPFPWRWGYGWPPCHDLLPPPDQPTPGG